MNRPPTIRLAATIDGGALTCHKGFIIYGIKFVQREFVNLILGKDMFDGTEEDVDGVQSVRLIQMLGFVKVTTIWNIISGLLMYSLKNYNKWKETVTTTLRKSTNTSYLR